ncbi:hypothetical protein BH10PSE14_BH10PSE14_04600 [soil metagenome]
MTKLRPPLSFGHALDRIAGLVTWAEMARIVDRKERAVRNWGDPDMPESCPIAAALALDIAYEQAGGLGSPMFDAYAHQVRQSRNTAYADRIELARRAASAMKEVGEAGGALVMATLPDATAADRATALREVSEGIDALTATMPLLTEGGPPT